MGRPKKATGSTGESPGNAVRPEDFSEAGGRDAAAGAQLAVGLLNRHLEALTERTKPELDAETGALVALYARTLSGIEREQRKGSRGEYGGKTTEELLELALQVPELRDLLKDKV